MKRTIRALALLAAMLLSESALAANVLELPGSVAAIEAEAFMGVSDADIVRLPSGVTTIGDRAFKDMSYLQTLYIPGSVVDIGSDILDGAMDAALIVCEPDSDAMRYAIANHVDYEADTVCRALLVGNEYQGADNNLIGPFQDANGMMETLIRLPGRDYACTVKNDLTCEELDYWIGQTFSGAKDQDISLFFFSGHGASGGKLTMLDSQYSPERLRAQLDAIPGRKIIIVDACFSGGMIQAKGQGALSSESGSHEDEDAAPELQAFQDSFLAAFTPTLISKSAFNPSDYFVLTAARYDQTSDSIGIVKDDGEPFWYGLFTYNLCRGCGYDYLNNYDIDLLADVDGDRAISMAEAYDFIASEIPRQYARWGWNPSEAQNVQAYPADCRWFAPFRDFIN